MSPANRETEYLGPEPRLVTHIWVQAQVKLCDMHAIPAMVVRRGDPDAGAILLRLLRGIDENLLLKRQTMMDGRLDWVVVGGDGAIDDAAADEYITRELDRDRDLWVLDVDDPNARYWPDKPIEA